jgi:hypothetical protein
VRSDVVVHRRPENRFEGGRTVNPGRLGRAGQAVAVLTEARVMRGPATVPKFGHATGVWDWQGQYATRWEKVAQIIHDAAARAARDGPCRDEHVGRAVIRALAGAQLVRRRTDAHGSGCLILLFRMGVADERGLTARIGAVYRDAEPRP